MGNNMERAINFNAAMVNAILQGRKTQTRRIIEPQPDYRNGTYYWPKNNTTGYGAGLLKTLPKEWLAAFPFKLPGDTYIIQSNEAPFKIKITSVRVERLHDISEADATAEGIDWDDGHGRLHPTAKIAFENLWIDIYGTESWHSNPWVWVIEFKKLADKADGEH